MAQKTEWVQGTKGQFYLCFSLGYFSNTVRGFDAAGFDRQQKKVTETEIESCRAGGRAVPVIYAVMREKRERASTTARGRARRQQAQPAIQLATVIYIIHTVASSMNVQYGRSS